jgi:flagellar hook protein FlgE
MLGSMYSAISGLQVHQTKLNVIGNNIANVNTYGFKSSRVTFSDVFYQTLNGASSAGDNSGGTNPIQLGYGAKVNSIDVINTRAGSATTNRALDIYIDGEGYLPVKDSDGIIKYTRVGILSFDAQGNLVDNKGNMVLGIPFDSATGLNKLNKDGTLDPQDLVPIVVKPEELDKYSGISIGKNGEVSGIKEGDPTIVRAANTPWLRSAALTKDSVYSGDIIMSITRGEEVDFLPAEGITDVTVDPNADLNGEIRIRQDGSDYFLILQDGSEVSGTEAGGIVTFVVDDIDGNPVDVTVDISGLDFTGVSDISLGTVVANEIDISITTYNKAGETVNLIGTWEAGDTSVKIGDMTLEFDPARFGTLDTSDVQDRIIGKAGPGPGRAEKIANLSVAKFINPDGLSQEGDGYYVETVNSGGAVITVAGREGTGALLSGSLEMSNVDLSREFTEMIIAQRGFQANTRMITVSDEVLSELVNMKR